MNKFPGESVSLQERLTQPGHYRVRTEGWIWGLETTVSNSQHGGGRGVTEPQR